MTYQSMIDASETRRDEHGPYVVFLNKCCTWRKCAVPLTSRNRYGTKLLCKVHGAEAQKQRTESADNIRRLRADSAHNMRVYLLVRDWLMNPTCEVRRAKVDAAFVDHELFHRFTYLPLPEATPKPTFEIPIEDPPFPGKERMTRNEMRVVAREYGIDSERNK